MESCKFVSLLNKDPITAVVLWNFGNFRLASSDFLTHNKIQWVVINVIFFNVAAILYLDLTFSFICIFLVLFDLLYFCPTLWYMSSQQNYNMTKILTLTLFCKIKMKFRIFNTYHIKSKQSRPNQAMPPKYQALTLGLVCRSFEILQQ